MLTERPDIEGIERKNIIDMALGFTAMTRIFSAKSKGKIETRLEMLFTNLTEINTRAEYKARHRSFCEWFAREIRTAEKRLKNSNLQPSEPSSYGQGAEVLDIAIKVYVYYCSRPTAEIAERSAKIQTMTIKEVDESAY